MPTLQEILDAAAMCPAPIICKPPIGYDLSIAAPTTNPWEGGEVIDIQVRPGWSPSTGELCGHMSARSTREGVSSEWVQFGVPDDCMIATPEPAVWLLLACGVLALAWVGRKKP